MYYALRRAAFSAPQLRWRSRVGTGVAVLRAGGRELAVSLVCVVKSGAWNGAKNGAKGIDIVSSSILF